MRKGMVWICLGLMMLATPVWAEEPVMEDDAMEAVEETAAAETDAPSVAAPAKDYSETVSIGVCLAKGAGVGGVAVHVRPLDVLGLEFDLGSRLFIYQEVGSSTTTEVYMPLMWTAKMQFFFSPNAGRFQYGAELGYISAEDVGAGAEVAGVFRFRINSHWTVDANAGLGYFIDHENALYDYLARVGGEDRDYYERHLDSSTMTAVALMGGLGINFSF